MISLVVGSLVARNEWLLFCLVECRFLVEWESRDVDYREQSFCNDCLLIDLICYFLVWGLWFCAQFPFSRVFLYFSLRGDTSHILTEYASIGVVVCILLSILFLGGYLSLQMLKLTHNYFI